MQNFKVSTVSALQIWHKGITRCPNSWFTVSCNADPQLVVQHIIFEFLCLILVHLRAVVQTSKHLEDRRDIEILRSKVCYYTSGLSEHVQTLRIMMDRTRRTCCHVLFWSVQIANTYLERKSDETARRRVKANKNRNSRTDLGAVAPLSTQASFLLEGKAWVFCHIHGLLVLLAAAPLLGWIWKCWEWKW